MEGGLLDKIFSIDKETLSNLLPTYILNFIDICLVGLEYSIKIKSVVTQINSQHNTVMCMATYNNIVLGNITQPYTNGQTDVT